MFDNFEINKNHQQVIHISNWENISHTNNIEFEFIGIENTKMCNPGVDNWDLHITRELGINGRRYLLDDYLTDVMHFDISLVKDNPYKKVKVFLPKEDIDYSFLIDDQNTEVTINNLNLSGISTNCNRFTLNRVSNTKPRGMDIYRASWLEVNDSNIEKIDYVGPNCTVIGSTIEKLNTTSNNVFTLIKDSNVDIYKSEGNSRFIAKDTNLSKIEFDKIDAQLSLCRLSNIEGNLGSFFLYDSTFTEDSQIKIQQRGNVFYNGFEYDYQKKGKNKVLVKTREGGNLISTIKTKKVTNHSLVWDEYYKNYLFKDKR